MDKKFFFYITSIIAIVSRSCLKGRSTFDFTSHITSEYLPWQLFITFSGIFISNGQFSLSFQSVILHLFSYIVESTLLFYAVAFSVAVIIISIILMSMSGFNLLVLIVPLTISPAL
jgi:hypothetical protein